MFRQLNSRLFRHPLYSLPSMLASTAAKTFSKAQPDAQANQPDQPGQPAEAPESALLLTLGWVSAGLGAVALGLFLGRELRTAYKFNRRTPYDFYAHSGDELQDIEFSLGI